VFVRAKLAAKFEGRQVEMARGVVAVVGSIMAWLRQAVFIALTRDTLTNFAAKVACCSCLARTNRTQVSRERRDTPGCWNQVSLVLSNPRTVKTGVRVTECQDDMRG
jgi:hypothetical protein